MVISPYTNNHFWNLGLEINEKSMRIFLIFLCLLVLSSCSDEFSEVFGIKTVASHNLIENGGVFFWKVPINHLTADHWSVKMVLFTKINIIKLAWSILLKDIKTKNFAPQ